VRHFKAFLLLMAWLVISPPPAVVFAATGSVSTKPVTTEPVTTEHAANQQTTKSLTLGVFAYRPKEILQKRYQPLADYLSAQLGDTRVELQVLDQNEIELALQRKQLDLVFTNPSHYILLRSRYNLTGALATLVSMESGQAVSSLGGVIITRAKSGELARLADLKGRSIAAPGSKYLGGYQTQAYELLQAGVHLPHQVELQIIGNHDAVVTTVLAGKAEFGFIRTGIIEELSREGKLDPTQLRVINAQQTPGFPYAHSTRLYPEWAFVALPQVGSRNVRKIASSLMALDENHPAAHAAGIGGFAPPGDYLPVENLARALRMPPFDQTPTFTLCEVWLRWQGIWISLIGLVSAILMLQVWRLSSRNRALQKLGRENQQAELALRESEQHFRTLANSGSALIWTSGIDDRRDFFNETWLRFTGRRLDQELDNGWVEGVFSEDVEPYWQAHSEASQRHEPFDIEYRLRDANGNYRWILEQGRPRYGSAGNFIGFIGHCYDIAERKQSVEKLQLAANVFTSASEGIMITNADGIIVDVNQAFTVITGYSSSEAIGNKASILKSERQSPQFYTELWRSLAVNGRWSGEIWNRRKNGEIYPEHLTISAVRDRDYRTLHYVGLFLDITAQKAHQTQLEHFAHFDALTGLPNRVLLADRLYLAMTQARRRGAKLAVALIDLDGFKEINDHHGHKAGDELLMAIAERMRSALRESDTIARMGGDEFVAVMDELQQFNDCLPMIQRLLEVCAKPVQYDDRVLKVSCSIGVTFYPQAEPIEADQLLRQADQAMYQVKLSGKNRYYLFDADLDRDVRSHHESLEDFRRGLSQKEFLLHYQPKVNMRSGEVIGAEALVRWQHPERGLLMPALFLPIIEKHVIEIELGEWVVDTALTQIDTWRGLGLELPVSVNISALHLQQPDFVTRLQKLLAAHPAVKPGQLQLEVLETSALEDIHHVSQVINACVGMGVSFALDDFGTGYSSLTYLKHLPVELLKIDQSFVRDMLFDPEDLSILQGVQGLATAFQRQVIAEGVETELHGEILLQLGCDLAQGYGIARPMPPGEMPAWAVQWRPPATWNAIRQLAPSEFSALYASVQHRAWLKEIANFQAGERSSPPPLDHRKCHFGVWLENTRQNISASHLDFLQEVEALHGRIHDQANALLQIPGSEPSAHAKLVEIQNLSERLLECQRKLIG